MFFLKAKVKKKLCKVGLETVPSHGHRTHVSNNEKGRIFFLTRKKEKKTRNGDKCIEITLMAPHKCKDHDGNLVT